MQSFKKLISHKLFPQDVTGGWVTSKWGTTSRKRKTRDPRNWGATRRGIKGRPRAMAAQKAKITESPDVSGRMKGSERIRWGWKWQIMWHSQEQYWEGFYSHVGEFVKKKLWSGHRKPSEEIHTGTCERKYKASLHPGSAVKNADSDDDAVKSGGRRRAATLRSRGSSRC